MKTSDLREWARAQFGAHSHKEGQFLAALSNIDESIALLARQGIAMELKPVGGSKDFFATKALHGADEPPAPLNAGAVGTESDALPGTFTIPAMTPPQADTVAPVPPAEHFVGSETVPEHAPSSPEAPSDFPLAASSANS